MNNKQAGQEGVSPFTGKPEKIEQLVFETNEEIAKRHDKMLQKIRQAHNLSVRQLSKLTGIHTSTLSAMEVFRVGRNVPTKYIAKLKSVFSEDEIALIRDSFREYIREVRSKPHKVSTLPVEDTNDGRPKVLKGIRLSYNLSLTKLSELTGINPSTLNKMENFLCRREPTKVYDHLRKVFTDNEVSAIMQSTREALAAAPCQNPTTLKELRLKHQYTQDQASRIMGCCISVISAMERVPLKDINRKNIKYFKNAYSDAELRAVFEANNVAYIDDLDAALQNKPAEPETLTLKGLRIKYKLTLEDASRLMGVHKQHVWEIENKELYLLTPAALASLKKLYPLEELKRVFDDHHVQYIGDLEKIASKARPDGYPIFSVRKKPAIKSVPLTEEDINNPHSIKGLRFKHGLTLKEAANKMGIALSTAWKIENMPIPELDIRHIIALKRAYAEEELKNVFTANPVNESIASVFSIDIPSDSTAAAWLDSVYNQLSAEDKERVAKYAEFLLYKERGLNLPAVSSKLLSDEDRLLSDDFANFLILTRHGMRLPEL